MNVSRTVSQDIVAMRSGREYPVMVSADGSVLTSRCGENGEELTLIAWEVLTLDIMLHMRGDLNTFVKAGPYGMGVRLVVQKPH